MPVRRRRDATEPPGAREAAPARSAASARPRPCARRERALTQQVTRARPGGLLCHLGNVVSRRRDDGPERGKCFTSIPVDESPELSVFSL